MSPKLIPRLAPKPKVHKSELSIIMGNGAAQDTDHYVAVDLVLLETAFWAKLHLLELPPTFDVIVGTDWLTAHNVHVHVRARSITGGPITPPGGHLPLILLPIGKRPWTPRRSTKRLSHASSDHSNIASCRWGYCTQHNSINGLSKPS